MQLKDFAKLFFVLLIVHLAFLDVNENLLLIKATKPLLVLSLIAFFVHHTPRRTAIENLFLGGLILSVIGDVLLSFTNLGEEWFVYGLTSFLFAQVCYAISFFKDVKNGWVQRSIWPALPFLAYAVITVYCLQPNLGSFFWPVVAYASAFTAMAVAAINRMGGVQAKSFMLVIFGVILFLSSDTILAITKFVGTFNHAPATIMLTYGIAQFLMVWGMLIPRLSNDE